MLDFLIITTLICIIALWLQTKPFFWRGKKVAWKFPVPFLGSTAKSFTMLWHDFWLKLYDEIGDEPYLGIHYFSIPALVLKDPQLIKKVMITDSDFFLQRELPLTEHDPLSKSLTFSSGHRWKSQRAVLSPYFSPSRLKSLVTFLHPITDRFIKHLEDESVKGPVDVLSACHKLATDVIISNVFGLQPDSFDNPKSYFYELQQELMSFGVGIRALIGIMCPSLHRFLGLTIFSANTNKKLKILVNRVIEQRRKGLGVRPDLLQGMIELMEQEESKPRATENLPLPNDTRFDNDTVVSQCMLMYLAGTETAANTLSFLLYELALHEDIQNRLRDEINAMIAKTSGNYGYEEINKLTYMDQVISEATRKYPISASIGRTCTKPYALGDLEIPTGTAVVVPIIAIHRDANNYPDPMKFDPERFASPGNITPGTYMPFGLGPRLCIGMRFAQIEMAMALCKLLPKHKLLPSWKTVIPVKYSNHMTLSSDKTLWIDIKSV